MSAPTERVLRGEVSRPRQPLTTEVHLDLLRLGHGVEWPRGLVRDNTCSSRGQRLRSSGFKGGASRVWGARSESS